MPTSHQIILNNAQQMSNLGDHSVDVVVTSPPYPMIDMWDEIFAQLNPEIEDTLKNEQGNVAFEQMHCELDKVWDELYRVMKSGAIACINIGDATRTINGDFQLYSNHSRILSHCIKIGFSNLPNILWRKQTNAPNKFMGSGMLAPGAYVTLEHEHILIFRKGGKRIFANSEDKQRRAESAYFWEERNQWFSDVWDFKGTKQKLTSDKSRDRSAAYPFELAYRLINMFSIKGDMVLDPFLGMGTTTLAAVASGRNSIGYEVDEHLTAIKDFANAPDSVQKLNEYISARIEKHLTFVEERINQKGDDAFKHLNDHYGFPVITKQEKRLILELVKSISLRDNKIQVEYTPLDKKHLQEITAATASSD